MLLVLKRSLYFSMLAVLLALPVNGQSKVGTTAASFLQIGVGARGVAMGETAVASGRDLSSLYWNPALGAELDGHHLYFNHVDWFVGIDLNYGSAMLNLGNQGRFALTVYTMTSTEMDVITEERVQGTGEVFRVQDLSFGLTYSRALTDRFNLGITAKLVRSSIWNMNATTAAVDVGLTYRTPFEPVTLGMSISNFGGEMRLTGSDTAVRVDLDPRVGGNNDGLVANLQTNSWDLPVTLRFGVAIEALNTRMSQLTLSGDALFSNNNNGFMNAGLEYGVMNIFFIRGGYRQLMLEDAEGGLSLGAGIAYRGIHADYAFIDRGLLGTVNYLSLGVSIGG
ncbi:MAG: PorV/PorQ family protein [Rhodothermaceae bacterium]|nr:PorV/PorQ family protein [Rhodothermaceae bacterium]